MPNIRARRQPLNTPTSTLVALPPLAIGRFTLKSSGAVLSQADVRAFKTSNDVLVARDFSSPTGQYTISVPDTSAYYVVAIQDGTIDSTALTIDSTNVTIDRTQSVGGVSANSLVGSS